MSNKSNIRYVIMNDTDGIPAGFYEHDTREEAEETIKKMREAFKKLQGYYSSVRYGRIDPDDVQYTIHEIESEEDETGEENRLSE